MARFTYRPREITPRLLAALGDMPVVVLSGARQVGKSTLLREEPALAGRRYVTLDDFAALETARRQPEALFDGGGPVTIDEVQRNPGLLLAIKAAVDRERVPGRFLLSGSANLHLLAGVSETLAGRALYMELHPFNERETGGTTAEPPWLPGFLRAPTLPGTESPPIDPVRVLWGGMPAVCLGQVGDPTYWFEGYEQTYLERDVRNLAQVADLAAFRRLLRLVALRSGTPLNVTGLARDATLSHATTQRYLGLLETSFVLSLLPAFTGGRAARLIRAPKPYLVDPGLAAWSCHVERLDPTDDEPMRGALYETFVASNLRSLLAAFRPRARLHHWNLQGRHEVDFVVEDGSATVAIEVKAASRWGPEDLRGLKAFLAHVPECRAAVLAHAGSGAAALGERLWAIPISRLLA